MSEKNMSLYEKLDLLLKRQEQQDKALANMASLMIVMQKHTVAFQNAFSIAKLQSICPDTYESRAEEFESEYRENLNQAKSTKEQIEALYKAIQENLETERFHIRQFKITVENAKASSI